jgi:bifunctional DNA-binding transcriptional regulator/antitoxin component of YhaV-PrlF toxin-antitoxin module
VIAPVVPPLLPASGRVSTPSVAALVRGPLPLPSLISRRTSTVVYGLSALDDRGRLADRVIMRVLGWAAGLQVDIRETGGVLTVLTDPEGAYQITTQGHLRLPAPLRHRCGLQIGDRILLAADPDRSRLAVYRPQRWTLSYPSSPPRRQRCSDSTEARSCKW